MTLLFDTSDLIVEAQPATLAARADPLCPYCSGTGFYYNEIEQAVVPCGCVKEAGAPDDDDDTSTSQDAQCDADLAAIEDEAHYSRYGW